MHFNVEKYLTNEFARRFGRTEEQVFINGTGINEPSGLLMTAETGRSIDTAEVYLTMILSHCILQRSLTSGKMVSG